MFAYFNKAEVKYFFNVSEKLKTVAEYEFKEIAANVSLSLY